MTKKIKNDHISEFHPMRAFFEYLILEFNSGIKTHLSGKIKGKMALSRYSKSKELKKYLRETIENFLIGDIKILAEYYLERGIWPKKISLKYKSIPSGVFRIILDQRLQKLVQLMAIMGDYSVTEITTQANEYIGLGSKLSVQVVGKYLYYFWNVLPSEGQESLDRIRRIQFLVSDRRLSEIYSDHIEVALGNLSPFEIAIKLGMNEKVSSQLNAEVYKGFALTVARKNEAMMSNRLEEADTLSKIMSRDSQVLRNMGHKPKKKALREQVNVVYADKD